MEDMIHTYPAGAVLALLLVLVIAFCIWREHVCDKRLLRAHRDRHEDYLKHGWQEAELKSQVKTWVDLADVWRGKYNRVSAFDRNRGSGKPGAHGRFEKKVKS